MEKPISTDGQELGTRALELLETCASRTAHVSFLDGFGSGDTTWPFHNHRDRKWHRWVNDCSKDEGRTAEVDIFPGLVR